MKYLFDVDKTGSTTARLLNLALNCIFAGDRRPDYFSVVSLC
jgi:hypothetical protein